MSEIEHYMRAVSLLKRRVVELEQALVGANWIISKLAPHETMNILVRGYRVDAEDAALGAKYRAMIDAALDGVEKEQDDDIQLWRREPCSSTCFNHVTHPCEKCGYQAGPLHIDNASTSDEMGGDKQ